MLVLGIESSCDETAAALVNDNKEIISSAVLTQSEHKNFGGVVPEIKLFAKPLFNHLVLMRLPQPPALG